MRKKREVRASDNVSERKGDDDSDAGTVPFPFAVTGLWSLLET